MGCLRGRGEPAVCSGAAVQRVVKRRHVSTRMAPQRALYPYVYQGAYKGVTVFSEHGEPSHPVMSVHKSERFQFSPIALFPAALGSSFLLKSPERPKYAT